MIHTGDCVTVMATMEPDSVDAVVTDPPYGLEFMGKGWDKFGATIEPTTDTSWDDRPPGSSTPFGGGGQRVRYHKAPGAFQAWCEAWGREALRVTKPGGYLLAFGGTRTHHRLVCGLEDAGWIIRDELDWIYASGFPKGRANLKPAHEPIVLARKPGPLRPLNIEETRIGYQSEKDRKANDVAEPGMRESRSGFGGGYRAPTLEAGRWPSNLLLQDAELFDEPNPGIIGSGGTEEGAGYSRFFGLSQGKMSVVDSRFWSKVEKSEGCWTWTSSRDEKGYGRFYLDEKQRSVTAHRLAWELTNGAVPEGMHVLHHCDNPPCVNPDHLWLGTHDDNMADMVAKGRTGWGDVKGEERYNAQLTEEIVREARTLHADGWTYAQLQERYGVHQRVISKAVRRVSWKHVADDPEHPIGYIIPKADRADREPVLRGQLPERDGNKWNAGGIGERRRQAGQNRRENSHATVKPTDLMRHLIRLVTPPGGTVLDPFLGSGSTAIAAELEGFPWIGIEKEPEYVAIAEARLNGTQRGLGLDVPAPTRKRTLGEGTYPKGTPYSQNEIFGPLKPDEEPAA